MTRRGGFAFPVTLFALIGIGALLTGAFFISMQETRIAVSADLATQAFAVAEYGVDEVLGTWRNNDVMNVASAGTTRRGAAVAGGRTLGEFEVTVDSLGGRLYMIRVDGTALRGPRSTTRRLAVLARTTSASLPHESALSILGSLSVEGRADISGTDGCDASNVVPGVSTPDATGVTMSGNGEVSGNPPVQDAATLTAASLSQFGDVSLDDMIAAATKIYSAGSNPTNMEPSSMTAGDGSTVCNTGDMDNWGDTISSNPCGDYYPLIYGEGDLALNGSGSGAMGQGILIVEGDLTIDGNVEFHGVVITKGDLYYAGNGGHVQGALIVMGNGASTSAGSSLLNYDSCKVKAALDGTLRPRPLDSRSWIDLSARIRPVP